MAANPNVLTLGLWLIFVLGFAGLALRNLRIMRTNKGIYTTFVLMTHVLLFLNMCAIWMQVPFAAYFVVFTIPCVVFATIWPTMNYRPQRR